MPKVQDVCRHVRSKNAGPFWITVDLFFHDRDTFTRYANDPALSPALFETLFGTRAEWVKLIPVESLNVLKISYPRPKPQGWQGERDMHSGQQCTPLLAVELNGAA